MRGEVCPGNLIFADGGRVKIFPESIIEAYFADSRSLDEAVLT